MPKSGDRRKHRGRYEIYVKPKGKAPYWRKSSAKAHRNAKKKKR